jgi:hypothetical protein
MIRIPTTNLAMQQMGDDDDTAEVMRRGDDAEEREGDAVKPERRGDDHIELTN